MNDVRKALIYGIENPPRGYTIEEWYIITEFARHVAEHSKESLKQEVQEVIEKLKQGKPCVAIDTIDTEDVVYKEPIDTKPIHRINIDNIKAIDCQTGEIHYEPKPDNVRPIKDDRVSEVKILFKCPYCKYMANDFGEKPCCDCHDFDKCEESDL